MAQKPNNKELVNVDMSYSQWTLVVTYLSSWQWHGSTVRQPCSETFLNHPCSRCHSDSWRHSHDVRSSSLWWHFSLGPASHKSPLTMQVYATHYFGVFHAHAYVRAGKNTCRHTTQTPTDWPYAHSRICARICAHTLNSLITYLLHPQLIYGILCKTNVLWRYSVQCLNADKWDVRNESIKVCTDWWLVDTFLYCLYHVVIQRLHVLSAAWLRKKKLIVVKSTKHSSWNAAYFGCR